MPKLFATSFPVSFFSKFLSTQKPLTKSPPTEVDHQVKPCSGRDSSSSLSFSQALRGVLVLLAGSGKAYKPITNQSSSAFSSVNWLKGIPWKRLKSSRSSLQGSPGQAGPQLACAFRSHFKCWNWRPDSAADSAPTQQFARWMLWFGGADQTQCISHYCCLTNDYPHGYLN